MSEKVQGPASYFPSIEEEDGQPIDYWFAQLEPRADLRHTDMVEYRKTEHGMGHGRANASVVVFRHNHGLT